MGVSMKPRLYGELKRKRHLYLTDTAHKHLVDLAHGNDSSPSEVCEQIIRLHVTATAIPSTPPLGGT
jgi:hypothetical protein